MHSTEEQLPEVLKRIGRIKEKKAMQKRMIADGIAAAVCLVLMIAAGAFIPGLGQGGDAAVSTHYGSLILSASNIGYVVIGGLAFALGVFITLLCLHLRRMRNIEREDQ